MPSFDCFIFGNLPVTVDIDKDGFIEEVMVKGLKRSLNPSMSLYLELDDATRNMLMEKLDDEIQQCLTDHEQNRRAHSYDMRKDCQ